MAQPYLVVRLVPDSPISGATFTSYLNGLRLQAVDAYTLAPLSDYVYASPLIVSENGFGSGQFGAVVSVSTSASTTFVATNNYGTILTFDAADGISVGAVAFTTDPSDSTKPGGPIPAGSNLTVIDVTKNVVTLSGNLPQYVAAGTVVQFVPQTIGNIVTTSGGGVPTFTVKTNGAVTDINGGDPLTTGRPAVLVPVTSVDGMLVGMAVTGTGIGPGTTVAGINPAPASGSIPAPSILLSQATSGAVPSGTTLTLTWVPPYVSLTLTPSSSTATTLTFSSGSKAQGVGYGMTLSPVPGVIDPGTTVKEATTTTVTLSKPLSGGLTSLPAGQQVTFNFPLSNGIVQDSTISTSISFFSINFVVVPEAVATAIIPLNGTPPTQYLDIKIVATRDAQTLPLDNTYYNVYLGTDTLPTPDQYQNIPPDQTSLYLSLPPPPIQSFIQLSVPKDGTPPPFDALASAINAALTGDKAFAATVTIETLAGSPSDCTRVAYDIIWSYQNTLPLPPDLLDNLYTNPPNPGGSADNTNSGSNNLEQDRIKFEGTLNSFYSTRNATAERLTKFVAAASAAVYCERTSLNFASALLEFPVDPAPTTSFATAVESELLVQGIGESGVSGLAFGVPAAFFYALGARQDKTASALRRFQTATGDAIERLLQEFSAAVDADVIEKSEGFSTDSTLSPISTFQAARRLVALRASALSTTPTVTAYAGSSLTSLVQHWLNQDDPTPTPPPNPPLTYANTDFNIWTTTLGASDPQGYLYLDLDALTQGYIIPVFTQSVSSNVASGSALTFTGGALGIGPGMTVSGPNIPSGTRVKTVSTTTTGGTTTTTVTLSAPLAGGGVTTTDTITFNAAAPAPIQIATNNKTTSGNVLPFATTSGIKNGWSVFGADIPAATTVSSVGASSVTLSNAIAAAVPSGALITFADLSALPSTLADQIYAWLPQAASAAPPPTIAELKAVTANLWNTFFTVVGNSTWLPPFTRPVAPGAAPSVANPSAGYIAVRIRAFIRAVQLFFTVSSVPTTAQLPAPGAPPTFDMPAFDPIKEAVNALPAGFKFATTPITSANLATAVVTVFPTDPAARGWLTEVMTAVSELSQVASVVANPTVLPNPVSLQFAIVEALYARGFRSAADIARLSAAAFQQALIGTVAYDFANSGTPSLYQEAGTVAAASTLVPWTQSPGSTDSGGEAFQPINPDGSLVNCVPPPCLSPTSPIAYLQEMLKLSSASTCKDPWPAPAAQAPSNPATPPATPPIPALDASAPSTGSITLALAFKGRRGPVGDLLANCANLQTPIPLIDIVNENLEYLAATQPMAGGSTSSSPSGIIYNTSADKLAGYELCKPGEDEQGECARCHVPAPIFAALAEYSTPATPVAANQAVEPTAFNNLKKDFSACLLPYSQALDVSRTYLSHLGSCRFEELRTFRKCITEFALDPTHSPAGFQSHLWRYPVRIETAIEYLGISPEEYTTLFQGTAAQPCAAVTSTSPSQRAQPSVTQILGLKVSEGEKRGLFPLPTFLGALCLSYCEFLELFDLGLIQVRYGNLREGQAITALPECEPCCLTDYRVAALDSDEKQLLTIIVFVRLWKKLREVCGARYSFKQLYDICRVLRFVSGGALNPEFIRQLAAFQMLRDLLKLPLLDPADRTPGATDADRTHLLALWVGSGARKWDWAVRHLVAGIESHALTRFGCARPREEFVAHIVDNLDPLSRLAGFNPSTPSSPSTDTWNSSPACTLRFAEVLAKMAASNFRISELLYLFNAATPHDVHNPFPPQDPEEAVSHPLGLPDDEPEESLWRLRESLLRVEVIEEEACEWTWSRITNELREKFGYAPPSGTDPLVSIGQHFFPDVLSASGFSVGIKQRQYRTALASTLPWNSPTGSPFQYDSGSGELWIQLPLRDEAVAATLSQLAQLSPAEQAAAQDLYFAPRADLALLRFLLPDWQAAEIHLIQERDEERRWRYFRHHFALACARRRIICEHLARHVERRTGLRPEHLAGVAATVLSHLLADENTGTSWESDSGAPPAVLWKTSPAGGAIASLMGLVGTGLLGEYGPAQSQAKQTPDPAPPSPSSAGASATPPATAPASPGSPVILWREVRGPLEGFGHERDTINSPMTTVLPPLGLSPTSNPLVVVHNGYADRASDGLRLGGAGGFQVRWTGVLLIEREGEYVFHAGAPTPEGERPDFEHAERSQWRLTLERSQKTWVILNHRWPGETHPERNMPHLRRGAYHIVIEYNQEAPHFGGPHPHPHQTGFQVKYRGHDSDGCLVSLPLRRLYRDHKNHTLDQGVQFLPGSSRAQAFLQACYTSTLRDIRRTYQRAFKAVLFAGKLALSPTRNDVGQSELGYMLDNPALFAGRSYYRSSSSTSFTTHLANLDFDFLPIQDDYHAAASTPPDRSAPSLQRTAAMFDWWERLFDYDCIRREIHPLHKGPLWHLFEQAQQDNPTDAAELLRHIGAAPHGRPLELRFYQDQSSPIYAVTSSDLQDDRWLMRVWRADRWIRALLRRFHPRDIGAARPELWASEDPSTLLPAAAVTQTGNANLAAFLDDGYIENGEPRRYYDLQRLNDGLRDRGRRALIAYLCSANRVQLPWFPTTTYATCPRDLSDLLLLDVETGLCEKSSRIEEAISAVQVFVRRARLGLEPGWKAGYEFARLWESRFETYHIWERCKRRDLYKENWITWRELEKARRIEAFRFLESKLRASTLTLAAPGGLDWWPDDDQRLEHAPELLQRRVPSELQALVAPPQSATREGLGVLGNPEYTDEATWLAPVAQVSADSGGDTQGGSTPGGGTPGTPSAGTPGTTGGTTGTPVLASNSASVTRRAPASRLVARASKSTAAAASVPVAGVPAAAMAAGGAPALADTSTGSTSQQPRQLPFWMESAIQLGTRFLRVAAAGTPQAALRFTPHGDEPHLSCCDECGHEHETLVDEYYFWLIDTQYYEYNDDTDSQIGVAPADFTGSLQFGFQDSFYDKYQQQSTEWNDEDQVPQLLAKWQPKDAVRLAWCRVHNGQFQQLRRSVGYVPISSPADLIFLGRAQDSVYFQISGGSTPPPAGYQDTSPPGFRFDLPADEAIALPQVMLPPSPPPVSPPAALKQTNYPGALWSYPFFAYHDPGARLFPNSWFSPAALVGESLRTHCRFELALKWYQRAFDPLKRDCAWMDCSANSPQGLGSGQTQTPAQPQTPVPQTPAVSGSSPASIGTARVDTTDPGRAQQTTHEQIAAAAYQIWERHGRPPAEQAEDWLQAEAELKAPPSQTTTPASALPVDTSATTGAPSGQSPSATTATDQTTATTTTPVNSDISTAACCDVANVTDQQARHRTVTLEYCQTLLDWGDHLMRRRHSVEAFQQARLLFDTAARIIGPRPRTILMPEPATPSSVSQFNPAFAPLNPRLLDVYDTVTDRLALIRDCDDARRLQIGRLHRDGSYFGDVPWREGWREAERPCEETACCCLPSPYRFTFQIQKALELAGKARELGSELLSAYEKGDAEMLASIRSNQEREMFTLGLSIRQDQWRDADWQIQGLQQTKDLQQTNLIYYTNLYDAGLINDEIQNLTLSTNAMQTRTSANIVAAVGECMTIVPDFFVGAMSTFSQIPIGTKLGGLFDAISKVMHTVADIQSATAAIDMTQAQWDRRSIEWFHQLQTLPIEIQQVELQILGAQRRRDQALQDLNNQQRQIENAAEVQDFLRDKFTSAEPYLYLQKHTAVLHAEMYELARCAAQEAQRAYNFELGHTTRRFVPEQTWDSLHEGLMAGKRLEAALQQMHKSYFDHNIREYELSKHFSLRLHFPQEFMRLRATGSCEIELPEWMYDLDYPGHYLRRIRSMSLTIPCVTGPYTGVHCGVTLLSSRTRIDPRLQVPPSHCCCDNRTGSSDGYEACPHDRRIVWTYGAREAIATSSGQNDSGLFELNFRDERRLPFEFHGAVCRLRIELPPQNNYFPMETLTDLMLSLNYTAREGGAPLRGAASEVAQKHLPGSGWCFFDVRHEFPDAWQLLKNHKPEPRNCGRLNLRLERRMFPFIPGACDLAVSDMAILFSAEEPCLPVESQASCECPCPSELGGGSHTIEVMHGASHREVHQRGAHHHHHEPRRQEAHHREEWRHENHYENRDHEHRRQEEQGREHHPHEEHHHDRETLRVVCEASQEWPELFCGLFKTDFALERDAAGCPEVSIAFPSEAGEIQRAYLLCRYRRSSSDDHGVSHVRGL